jgi:hypothetical protein
VSAVDALLLFASFVLLIVGTGVAVSAWRAHRRGQCTERGCDRPAVTECITDRGRPRRQCLLHSGWERW